MALSTNTEVIIRKGEFLENIPKFRNMIIHLEREITKSHSLYTESNLEVCRKQDRHSMITDINRMRDAVSIFQKCVNNAKPSNDYIEEVKNRMESIEKMIMKSKEQQKNEYEIFKKEELILTQDILAMEKRINLFDQQKNLPSVDNNVKIVKLETHKLTNAPIEVLNMHKFLDNSGGIRGGWDEYDHDIFLKFYHRHNGKVKFLDEACRNLPIRSKIDVENHYEWYVTYLDLLSRKKDAIHKWKIEKKNSNKDDVGNDIEDEDQEIVKCDRNLEKYRLQNQAMLNAWKIEKDILRSEKEQISKNEQVMSEKNAEKIKRKNEERKHLVEKYKLEKTQKEKEIKEHEDTMRKIDYAEKAINSKIMISAFQKRDMANIHEKILHNENKQKELQELKLKKMKQDFQVNVERDPHRLYQLTEGWKNRKKSSEVKSNNPMIHIPQRAVPSWRQGLL